jgi:hypothetical protein
MVFELKLIKERLGMSQQQKLEKVLDLLLSEDQDQAAELLHQIIVEKARTIYESIVDEEEVDADTDKEELDEADEVGGEPSKDFTDEIASDKEEVDADEQNDGEAGADDEAGEGAADDEAGEGEADDAAGEGSTEDRLEDLESQLADLRAEFDALMGEEMQEPQHADLGAEMGMGGDDFGGDDVAPAADAGMPDFGGPDEKVVGEVVAVMHEKKKDAKLDKAPEAKDKKKDKKVDEETQFLKKVADTGQKGKAGLVGTGKGMTLGAEQDKSPYTSIPARKDYGGKPTKIGGNGGTGGEYGKYNGDSAKDETISDNVDVKPKNVGIKADTTPKFTGGKSAGEGFTKSPLTKKPA